VRQLADKAGDSGLNSAKLTKFKNVARTSSPNKLVDGYFAAGQECFKID
jgi:hypothetical protein